MIDELLHSLQADVPGQCNIQLLCLITFPGTIKLPPPVAHVSEGEIRLTSPPLTPYHGALVELSQRRKHTPLLSYKSP